MNKAYFCIDIGGTKTAWALYDTQGRELAYEKFLTEPQKGAPDLVARVKKSAWNILREYNISIACVASPGPLDTGSGSIVHAVTMGWKSVGIVRLLEEAFGFRFLLLNDCDAGALGAANDQRFSACRLICYMSISTGIGGGVVLSGRLYTGRGNAGNFGHIPVPGDGLRCGCGQTDCLELYASGSGMERRYLERTGKICSCAEIEVLARQGDPAAKTVFADASKYLGFAMTVLRAVLDPEIVIFGGSVCRAGDLIFGNLASEYPIGFAPDDGKQVLQGAFVYAKGALS